MTNQNQIVQALMKTETYDEPPGHIETIQTHISHVFLTKDFVYKMKKQVNFGFLDFSTLEKRRFFCKKELELNKRLCDDMYIEVAPINQNKNSIKIKGEGEPIEYVLKMKRMPQEKIMTILIESNKVDNKLIEEISRTISVFHSKSQTNKQINEFGSLKTIKTNWDENFEQTKSYIGKTISQTNLTLIKRKINSFIEKNKPNFEKRVMSGRIRDCHGDIHSGNIFITDRIYIFDAIEFNERFRYSDVAADIAFLAMDLDFRKRKDLSDLLVKKYIEFSEDETLSSLLPFYKCYRAYVRGKVISFKLDDSNICDKEKSEAIKEAKAYFSLATKYAKKL